MNIYEIGLLQIFLPKSGINRDALQTEYRKGKMEFTRKAVRAYNEEKQKRASILIPITNVAFQANGASESTFNAWIKTIVWDQIRSTNSGNYSVEEYQDLRNKLVT